MIHVRPTIAKANALEAMAEKLAAKLGRSNESVSIILAALRTVASEADEALDALHDLREAAVDAYKAGRIPAEPFVRAGNVLAKARRTA